MTPREADVAAVRQKRVIYDGMEYLRITGAGYNYDDRGRRHPYIVLLDKCKNSVTYADPSKCTLKPE